VKRICFFADAKSCHTQRWVNYFFDRGYEVFLLSFDRSEKIKAEQHLLSPRISHPALKFFFAKRDAKRIIEKIDPDLVNAHFVISYGLLGALVDKKPLVVSCWGSDILISPKKSFFHKFRVNYVLKKADLLTSDGANLTSGLINLGIDENKIVTSPMGVDEKFINPTPEVSPRKTISKDFYTVLSTRSFEPRYDVKTLVMAIPLVIKNAKKKVNFIVIGEGKQKEDLSDLAKKLNIEDYVEFKGRVSEKELLRCYQDADIYVSTSLSDSTSVSLLEAMASGLVPIVTDIPGNREWIKDGGNGFLFPAKHYEFLSRKILEGVNDFERYNSFAKKNVEIIKQKALWEENMKVIGDRFLGLCDAFRSGF
jgi:glycosyltransferase involved in cell wall biosynthesis